MTWTTADIPDQHGRVAVVTGANGGLGLETATALAGAGADVVMATRDQAKARTTRDGILEEHPDASLEIVELDLGSLASIARAAARILDRHRIVDILVNNAGLMAMPERSTEDGFEMQLGVNHLGHWALTAHLMPAILAAEAARVVTVTSTAHHFGRALDPDDPHMRDSYGPWKAYNRAKLANYHFALGLQQEFEQAGVDAQSLVAHPGLSHTNLQVRTVDEGGTGWTGRFWRWLARTTGMEPSRGALPQLRAATDPNARGGQMYAPRFVNNGAPVRRPILRPGRASAIEDCGRSRSGRPACRSESGEVGPDDDGGPPLGLAARRADLSDDRVETLAAASWRPITRPRGDVLPRRRSGCLSFRTS